MKRHTRGLVIISAALLFAYFCAASLFLYLDRMNQNGDRAAAASVSSGQPTLQILLSGTFPSRLAEQDDFIKTIIEQKFEVNLDVTTAPAGSDYTALIAAKLAANNPPDMWLNITSDGGAKYTLDNVLADMTYYVTPSTMPNYFKYWITEKELKEYQVHNKFARAPIPYDKKSYHAYYIRKDWLDRLGLDIPQTYEQYVATLKAFTYQDPDSNGTRDTFGFSTSGNGTSISTDWPEYVRHGLLAPVYYSEGKLIDMQTDLRVGRVIDDIIKLTKEGVIDPDWFLNMGTQHIDKAVQGEIGVVLGETSGFALDSNPDSLQARSKAINPKADWMPFNPFGNKQPLRAEVSANYPFVFSNNTAGGEPEKLMKIAGILDWLASTEGFLLTHYGIEGKHYTREGSRITLLPTYTDNEAAAMELWSFFTPNTPEMLGLTVIDPRVTERDKLVLQTLADIPVYEGLGTTLTPPIGIDVEEMRARQDELQVKMLFSDKSGANWPQYRQELMSSYNGDVILKQYESKIRSSHKERQ
ncbi:extracellular solute-binding protein [Paenibacillus sp. GCM10027626]|uniref:extracellular solute-binding protein n=1 Tax=Paenibacillus sp. GCM10027626 TaxID=3273411 RepID=UPI003640E0AE